MGDIFTVLGSEVRPKPSNPIGGVIGAPQYLGASLVLLVSVIFLRQAQIMESGLVLLLLVPGFFYVTYQNFANDPQWIYIIPLILLALRPVKLIRNSFGWSLGHSKHSRQHHAMAKAPTE